MLFDGKKNKILTKAVAILAMVAFLGFGLVAGGLAVSGGCGANDPAQLAIDDANTAVSTATAKQAAAVKAQTETKSEVMHASVTGSLQVSTQDEICKVVEFLAAKGADLDPLDANGRTPIMIANVLPIDKAVELITKLIKASGAEPKVKTTR